MIKINAIIFWLFEKTVYICIVIKKKKKYNFKNYDYDTRIYFFSRRDGFFISENLEHKGCAE